MIEEDEDEITSVHGDEPLLPPTAVGPVRPGSLVSARREAPRILGTPAQRASEETVLLTTEAPAQRVPEETMLLPTDAPGPGGQAQPLRPGDSGWGTVVLPGGGHPDHVDRTQILALDEPDEHAAARSATARLSLGAPEPVEAVDTGGLTSIRPPAGLEPFPALPATMRGPSPEAWAIPRVGLASAPAGSPAGAGSTGGRAASSPAGGPAVPATGSASSPAAGPVASPSDGPGTVPAVASERRITAPPSDGPGTVPAVASERRSTAPPTSGTAVVPGSHTTTMVSGGLSGGIPGGISGVISGGHPVTAPTAGHPMPGPAGSHPAVISGGHPVVGVPPSGGHPMVISGGHPAVGATPTGGHPVISRGRGRAPAPVANADTRLAWGFLLGVLITVAIVSVAVALGLYFMG